MKDRAKRDEGAGKQPENNERQRVATGFGGSGRFAGQRHIRRQHGVDGSGGRGSFHRFSHGSKQRER